MTAKPTLSVSLYMPFLDKEIAMCYVMPLLQSVKESCGAIQQHKFQVTQPVEYSIFLSLEMAFLLYTYIHTYI